MTFVDVPQLIGPPSRIGAGLRRPEGVAVGRDGDVWASDDGGLVAQVGPGEQTRRVGAGGDAPNGIAWAVDGSLLIAEFNGGRVSRLDVATGRCSTVLQAIGDRRVGRPNDLAVGADGRVWGTNSTDHAVPRDALEQQAADGFVFVIEDGVAHVVAEGRRFPNGCALSADGRWLYVAHSGDLGVSRAEILPDGAGLGPFDPYGPRLDAIPDGVALDAAGNVWVTVIWPEPRLVVIDTHGDVHTVLAHEPAVARPTNLAFGGLDLTDVLVASIDLDHVIMLRTDVPGLPLPHAFSGGSALQACDCRLG